ncbi:helicase associated domain-containing protein [Streptomyces fimicarius]|uniref:helicase associated domain-containing protein n=1 Tax=Streptomyces griseus TaxID=1911 RepID=UPI0036803F21
MAGGPAERGGHGLVGRGRRLLEEPRYLDHPPDRLTALGLAPRPAAPATTNTDAKGGAFERGIAALTQYAAREGRIVVPRAHIEETSHGPVRLGTWISNIRSRRNKLTDQQREQLAALGVDWATA